MKNEWLLPVVRGVVLHWCLNVSGRPVCLQLFLVKARVSSWWNVDVCFYFITDWDHSCWTDALISSRQRNSNVFLLRKKTFLAVRMFSGVIGCFKSLKRSEICGWPSKGYEDPILLTSHYSSVNSSNWGYEGIRSLMWSYTFTKDLCWSQDGNLCTNPMKWHHY